VAIGLILAALSAGAGGGVAIAATQGAAKHANVPTKLNKPAVHHCHAAPPIAAL
jgi:hypothetical protein